MLYRTTLTDLIFMLSIRLGSP